ncbi:MAG: PAS domain-containing protein [Rhodospirillales bacterium]|nr:PAS domain-containing protein [Rhodospirillales bacterium]
MARVLRYYFGSARQSHGGKTEAAVRRYPPVKERRLNMHLMGYWQALRGTAQQVTPDQFDPTPLGELWAHCFVVDADPSPARMTFRHLGSKIAANSGAAADLATASEVPPKTLLALSLRGVPDVLQEKQPIVSSGEFTDFCDRYCLYRSILLPLGTTQDAVRFVAGGARCKVVKAR